MSINAVITTETIRNYKRLNYELWYALAEFIDNSVQSYYSNKETLDSELEGTDEKFNVRIVFEKNSGLFRITDNALGMDRETLIAALIHGRVNPIHGSRNEFGMGMKTAACWLGSSWTLRTTALGNSMEYQIEYDVERIATGDVDLREQSREVDPNAHYTIVEIVGLNRSYGSRRVGKTKDYLRSMYRTDTRFNGVDLMWGDECLTYEESLEVLKAVDGTEYRRHFEFELDGKKVSGWGAVLARGTRNKAGFAILRRGRVIQGQPTAWKPSKLFGQEQGSNDLVNQRLVGEIVLDDFLVSQQKDAILWEGEEEDEIDDKLFEIFAEYRQTALSFRVRDGVGPSGVAVTSALDDVASTLSTKEFSDTWTIKEVPTPELAKASQEHILEHLRILPGDREVQIGDVHVKIFLGNDLSPNDPYYSSEMPGDNVVVVINTKHPFWIDVLDTHDSIVAYMIHCVYDALAEKKCTEKIGSIQPDTVKMIKDDFLRMPIVS